MKRCLAAFAVIFSMLIAACGSTHQAVQDHPVGPIQPAGCAGYITPYGCQAHSATFGLPPTGLTLTPQSVAPTKAMYDSIVLSTIPANPPAVAGYVAGHWPTYPLLAAAFPSAIRIPIAVQANEKITGVRMACLDVEPGDATPSQDRAWVNMEIAAHVKPCIYASLSTMPQVKATLSGLARSAYFLWDADWTFVAHLDLGYDATQWTDHYLNRNLDANAATFAFLGINPKPQPAVPVCITHRIPRATCTANKAKIAKDNRAAASSQRAYKARGCNILSQRVSWFSTQLKRHPKVKTQSRRSALRASQRAYRQRSCGVYEQRVNYFTQAAAKLTAAS